MRFFYLFVMLCLMVGCSKDGGSSVQDSAQDDAQSVYSSMSVYSLEGLVDDDGNSYEYPLLMTDGVSGVSIAIDEEMSTPSKAIFFSPTNTDESIVIEFDDSGLPSMIAFDGNYIAVGNHSGTTCDISVISSGGDTFVLEGVEGSVDWDSDLSSLVKSLSVQTRYSFVDGLISDFKTIGIGVAYGVMSIGDFVEIVGSTTVDPPTSVSELGDKLSAVSGIMSNLAQAIVTALPAAEDYTIIANIANESYTADFKDMWNLYGYATDPTGAYLDDCLDDMYERAGEYLLSLIADETLIGTCVDNLPDATADQAGVEVKEGALNVHISMAPAQFGGISFYEPGGGYQYDSASGAYATLGYINYSVSSNRYENSSQHGAIVTYGDTWINIYYDVAPDGSYGSLGSGLFSVTCSTTGLPSGHNSQCVLTVSIWGDIQSYSKTVSTPYTRMPIFNYYDGALVHYWAYY